MVLFISEVNKLSLKVCNIHYHLRELRINTLFRWCTRNVFIFSTINLVGFFLHTFLQMHVFLLQYYLMPFPYFNLSIYFNSMAEIKFLV